MQSRSKYLVITSDYVLPSVIILGVSFLFWLVFYSQTFVVTEVICQTDYDLCKSSALEAEVAKFKGTNIFRFDEETLKKRVLSGEFTVRSVEIKKTLPGKIVVNTQSVLPSLAVRTTADPHYITLDGEYRVVKVTSDMPNIPLVTVPALPPIQIGKSLRSDFAPLFTLVKNIHQKLTGIKSIEKGTDGAIIVQLDQIQVVMSDKADLDKQIRLLQLVLTDPTIVKGKSLIDVRFAQPIIK